MADERNSNFQLKSNILTKQPKNSYIKYITRIEITFYNEKYIFSIKGVCIMYI